MKEAAGYLVCFALRFVRKPESWKATVLSSENSPEVLMENMEENKKNPFPAVNLHKRK